jgi:hypothetical protein
MYILHNSASYLNSRYEVGHSSLLRAKLGLHTGIAPIGEHVRRVQMLDIVSISGHFYVAFGV